MHHELLVGVVDRVAHVDEEPQPPLDVEAVVVAVREDVVAPNVLHGVIGLPVRCDTPVDESGDARMLQASQDPTLLFQAPREHGVGNRPADELEGYRLLEAGPFPDRQRHHPHPSLPQGADDAVLPDSVGVASAEGALLLHLGDEPVGVVGCEQRLDLPAQRAVGATALAEELLPRAGGELQRFEEDVLDQAIVHGIVHGWSSDDCEIAARGGRRHPAVIPPGPFLRLSSGNDPLQVRDRTS